MKYFWSYRALIGFLQIHHTATHLLQAALKKVIGDEATQAGSLVAFDRMRFDFNFHQPLQEKELMEIEELINKWIGDAAVLQTKVMPLADAKRAGAIAMFGEKYGEQVQISIKSIYIIKNAVIVNTINSSLHTFLFNDLAFCMDSSFVYVSKSFTFTKS